MGKTTAKRHHVWVLTSHAGDNLETHTCSVCGAIRKKFSAKAFMPPKKTPAPTYRYHVGDKVLYCIPYCNPTPYLRK